MRRRLGAVSGGVSFFRARYSASVCDKLWTRDSWTGPLLRRGRKDDGEKVFSPSLAMPGATLKQREGKKHSPVRVDRRPGTSTPQPSNRQTDRHRRADHICMRPFSFFLSLA